MKSFKFLYEAAYAGNIGFEEMVKFYQSSDSKQEKAMDKAIKHNDWVAFKALIKSVLGTTLK